MTFRHLNIFLSVCDLGSMTAAAEKLYVAQPSISQAISELERHYQVKLFERLGRKLFLTAAGERLRTYARHIVHLNQEAAEAMREVSQHGEIRIGASVTVGTYLLSGLVKRFAERHPAVKVTSSVSNTKVIEDGLLEDRIDIGLVEGEVHSPWLLTEPFMEDELVLACAASHDWAKAKSVAAAQLSGEVFFVREAGSGTRELFEMVMAGAGISWRAGGVYNNAETIKAAVSAGLGHTVISRLAVRREAERGELSVVALRGLQFKRTFQLVQHKNKYISPAMESFITLVRSEGKTRGEHSIC
ncbi:LysR family transcriptional regulator [Azotosporobacter soli]|uniref:LysR family transcriptional regulator n=1 Tax=Azotosporobacter soli TaxID=3055040 RepID=UPI0031FEA312